MTLMLRAMERDFETRQRSVVTAALRWLTRRTPQGELPCLVGEDRSLTDAIADSNYFAAAQALWSLGRGAGARTLVGRLSGFLASGAEPNGAWRFWTHKTYRAIDADTDMTACAAAALRSVGADVPTATSGLLSQARDASGRFVTWVRSPDAPNDVCAVVNANVVWYLGERPETNAAIEWLLELAAGTEPLPLGYYDTPLFFHHALSRAAFDGVAPLAVAKDDVLGAVSRLRSADGAYGTALDTALGLCTLENFGERDLRAERWLVDQQGSDGSWPAAAFWNGPEQPAPRSLWWGSAELTTSVVVEALTRSLPPLTPRRRRG